MITKYYIWKTKFQNPNPTIRGLQDYLKLKLDDHKNACFIEGKYSSFDQWLVIYDSLERLQCTDTNGVAPLPPVRSPQDHQLHRVPDQQLLHIGNLQAPPTEVADPQALPTAPDHQLSPVSVHQHPIETPSEQDPVTTAIGTTDHPTTGMITVAAATLTDHQALQLHLASRTDQLPARTQPQPTDLVQVTPPRRTRRADRQYQLLDQEESQQVVIEVSLNPLPLERDQVE